MDAMVTVTALPPGIRRYPLSVLDVERMVGAGILAEDAPLELLEGELVAVSPQGPEHASGRGILAERLRRAFRELGYVREQDPLVCGEHNLPEPDIAVVRGTMAHHRRRHPLGEETLLVVEVANTSQRVDRSKARIYARAGVPEYWLVDLVARTVTIHRDPGDEGYARLEMLDARATLELPAGVRCPIAELLP